VEAGTTSRTATEKGAVVAVGAEPALTEAQAQLFLEPNYGVAAAIRPDGTPQLSVVWVDWDGEHVLFNTAEGRYKPEYLRRDPRVTVFVMDREDPYRWVSVTGRAELVADGAEDHIHELSRKYKGRDYTLRPGEQRLLVKVDPERVTAYKV
jgi:PPOX class probable F420-dependent enzyme